jgi:hypothetical protein
LQASLLQECLLKASLEFRRAEESAVHACPTKLSTTFFSPAFSKAMVSLLPIFTTWPWREHVRPS